MTQAWEECDEAERELVGVELCHGLAPCGGHGKQLLYVLTLGVLDPYRQAGLGSHLVRQVRTARRPTQYPPSLLPPARSRWLAGRCIPPQHRACAAALLLTKLYIAFDHLFRSYTPFVWRSILSHCTNLCLGAACSERPPAEDRRTVT